MKRVAQKLIIDGTGAKLVSNWKQNKRNTETVSMLTAFKVSSLASKCLFYRSEHSTKEGLHGIEFWRSSNAEMKLTNRKSSKSSWEKWCHLLRSLKSHNWFIFWWQPKMSHSLGKVFVCNWMILLISFRKWYDL